jgi:hypothetical protein
LICSPSCPRLVPQGGVLLFSGSKFLGEPIFKISLLSQSKLSCNLFGVQWILTNVYGPCTPKGKQAFLN